MCCTFLCTAKKKAVSGETAFCDQPLDVEPDVASVVVEEAGACPLAPFVEDEVDPEEVSVPEAGAAVAVVSAVAAGAAVASGVAVGVAVAAAVAEAVAAAVAVAVGVAVLVEVEAVDVHPVIISSAASAAAIFISFFRIYFLSFMHF